ncbi:hypothetical protein [Nonomuraea sp. NPDC048916]|uniref:hypothetical protein n=1 Tax=Nonomuraea sp. NPDC048916 TaxID=3154232 RepID=UPI003411ADCA
MVSVETLMLRASTDSRWAYRRAVTVPGPGESPDEAARRVSGVTAGRSGIVVHSTSWRYLPEGEVVLTYAVCPDPAPWLPAVELPGLEIARGPAPASPTPERIEPAHVAAHAVRHLAYLVARDPVVREALVRHPELVAALAPAGEPAEAFLGELGTLDALDAPDARDPLDGLDGLGARDDRDALGGLGVRGGRRSAEVW